MRSFKLTGKIVGQSMWRGEGVIKPTYFLKVTFGAGEGQVSLPVSREFYHAIEGQETVTLDVRPSIKAVRA